MFGKLIFLVQMTLITGNLTGCSNYYCEEWDLSQSEVKLSSDRKRLTTPAIAIQRTDENGCRFLDVECASANTEWSKLTLFSSLGEDLTFEWEAQLQCTDEGWAFGGNNTVYRVACSYDFI